MTPTPLNILIPMGGLGSRFAKDAYRFPKPLIRICGREMLLWLLDHLDLQSNDRLWLALPEEMDEQFQISHRVRKDFPKLDIRCVPLRFQTRGAAETLFAMLQSMNEDDLERRTISLDCDTLYFSDILSQFRSLPAGVGASFFFIDKDCHPVFSYIRMDSDKRILEVKEKEAISRFANTGAYAFASAKILKKYCAARLDRAVGERGEYYTSGVLSDMLQTNQEFRGIFVESFVCVGTPKQLREFLVQLRDGEETRLVLHSKRKMRFCFDLDGTLVTFPVVAGDYASVLPIWKNIELVRQLHAAGHRIIIQTARRMKTHHGNTSAAIADIGRVTFDSLAEFEVPFDEIAFGKPYADVYVDDNAVHAQMGTFKEIGWLPRNKTRLGDDAHSDDESTVPSDFVDPRSFNTLLVTDDDVTKSAPRKHILGEAYFYENIPRAFASLFPRLLAIECASGGRDLLSLRLQRVNGVTLSRLHISQCITSGRLETLLDALKRLHSCTNAQAQDCNSLPNHSQLLRRQSSLLEQYEKLQKQGKSGETWNEEVSKEVSNDFSGEDLDTASIGEKKLPIYLNYAAKLLQRYDEDVYERHCSDSRRMLNALMTHLRLYEDEDRAQVSELIHGDPVFTNLLLTPSSNIVMLDMRGCLGSTLTVQGDANYDLAKVYQSLLGYDFWIHDVEISESVELYLTSLQDVFWAFVGEHYPKSEPQDIKAVTASLLFSMVPLHDRPDHRTRFLRECSRILEDDLKLIQREESHPQALSLS